MKKVCMILFSFVFLPHTYAQTVEEWTDQKKTQIKYLLQQIAALKVYTGHIQKGYAIARSGLTTIQSIKKGDVTVHQTFFSSLQKVSPAIQQYSKVNDI
ncbi:MAG: hypothetical protein M3342_03415, partial [Bacteroidota bacterium]|nr:hypothetical protein [Bacteroidota bacterium]